MNLPSFPISFGYYSPQKGMHVLKRCPFCLIKLLYATNRFVSFENDNAMQELMSENVF